MSKTHIKFTQVNKEYNLQEERTLKDFIPSLLTGKFWGKKHLALKNISFEIKAGENLAIVGKNGAGKSTIMKLIAQVTYPSAGKIDVSGKIAPLIELGAGFHHELSGFENIFLNAAVLGMSKSQTESLLDEIIAFSEISDFLHVPIKRYSSGMLVRLGFAVAIHSPADILLIDEVLAVGDISFKKKCLQKIENFKKNPHKIIIFVSHNQRQIKKFFDRAILLDKGSIIADSHPDKIFKIYNKMEDTEDFQS